MGGDNNEICKRNSSRNCGNSSCIYDVFRGNVKQKENDETSKKMGPQNGNRMLKNAYNTEHLFIIEKGEILELEISPF